MLLLIFVDNLE